ncbi:MAG: D-2-hydroxyacid dehydrogenase [Chloroflexi bacterium]|nr:D-2-hydroxyacid dehydrogenase [Chloroflexota bacterium]
MTKVLITARVTEEQSRSLQEISPDLEIVVERDPEKAREPLKDAEILCCFELPGPLAQAPKLKWIQLVSAGAEHLFDAGIEKTDIMVTTVSGIHAHAMAEYSVGVMVMMARRLPAVLEETRQRKWRPQRIRAYYGEELHGKTVGVLGLGGVGRAVAEACHCLGMRVVALRRSGTATGGVADRVYLPPDLLVMLAECDYVVVALPVTPETRALIGEKELRAMKPTARLVNVGRGELIDEAAMARALREGWIAGAALDVFVQEPLPADSELWDAPNLIVTPHLAGGTLPYMDRAVEVFRQNLYRYLAGEPMLNVLDKQRGY